MVMLQRWSLMEGEWLSYTGVVSLVEREWLCYRGGHFNGGRMVVLYRGGQFSGVRMVMLQRWSLQWRENGHVTEVVTLMEGK